MVAPRLPTAVRTAQVNHDHTVIALLMEGTRTAFSPSGMERIKASDVVTYVVGTMEAGKLAWPVPRSRLDGLRLKQVLDAIKMHLAQLYLDCLVGTGELADYE